SQDAARRKDGSNAGFGMIADDRADELLPAFYADTVEVHPDRAVRVLEIAGNRVSPEIRPRRDERVAEETIVLLVGVALENRCFDLAADLANRADGGVFADRRARSDDRTGANIAGALQHGVRLDQGIAIDVDRAMVGVEHHAGLDGRPRGDVNGVLVDK